jgi:hypothetical protein
VEQSRSISKDSTKEPLGINADSLGSHDQVADFNLPSRRFHIATLAC